MADSIMDSVLAMVTAEMQQSLAARLAEPPQSVYRGVGTAAAATLDGLASKAGDPVVITDTLNLVSAPDGTSAEQVNRLLEAKQKLLEEMLQETKRSRGTSTQKPAQKKYP